MSIARPLNRAAIWTKTKVLTAAGNFTLVNESIFVANKTSGAATGVTLPSAPPAGRMIWVLDGKGDAATNNITISPAAGQTIAGGSSYVISINYGGVSLVYDGVSNWTVAGDVSEKSGDALVAASIDTAGATTLTLGGTNASGVTVGKAAGTLTLPSATFVESSTATLAALGSTQGNAAPVVTANAIVTGADGTKGILLPTPTAVGQLVGVVNTNASALKVWPDSGGTGGTINGGSANANVLLAASKGATYICTGLAPSAWWSMSN